MFLRHLFVTVVTTFLVCGCTATAPMPSKGDGINQVDPADVMDGPDWVKSNWGALLTELNRGELLRINGHYARSTTAFTRADMMIGAANEWQAYAKDNQIELIDYRPSDFEKVMVSNRLALNYVGTGQWDVALTILQRNHAWFTPAVGTSASGNGKPIKYQLDSTTALRRGSYPFETLNDKAAIALPSSYQTALSYYTAGFLMEAQGTPLLAAQVYRAAMDLRPEIEILRKGFLGLQERAFVSDKKAIADWADVLFIVEAGNFPERTVGTVSLLATTASGPLKVLAGYPAVRENYLTEPSLNLHIGERSYQLEEIVNFRDLTRRSLRDAMNAAMTTAVSRAAANDEERQSRRRSVHSTGTGVTLVATSLASNTDMRAWTTLPHRIYFFRGRLPRGHHQIGLGDRRAAFNINLTTPFALIQVREYKDQIFLGSVGQPKSSISNGNSLDPVSITKPPNNKIKNKKSL